MAGLDPAIHVFAQQKEVVDARDKPGHDVMSGATPYPFTSCFSDAVVGLPLAPTPVTRT